MLRKRGYVVEAKKKITDPELVKLSEMVRKFCLKHGKEFRDSGSYEVETKLGRVFVKSGGYSSILGVRPFVTVHFDKPLSMDDIRKYALYAYSDFEKEIRIPGTSADEAFKFFSGTMKEIM